MAMYWKGRGTLSGSVGGKRIAIHFDEEIPEGLLDKDRVNQLRKKGKIGPTRKADDDAKIRETIAKNREKAAKKEKVGPKQ